MAVAVPCAAADFTRSVPAHQKYDFIDTGIDVKAGDRLELKASGWWVDFIIPCSADGYPADFLYAIGEPARLDDDHRYFRLLGRIGDPGLQNGPDTPLQPPDGPDPSATFVIGRRGTTLTAHRAGRLYVLVNDKRGFYWNNWGAMTLQVHLENAPGLPP